MTSLRGKAPPHHLSGLNEVPDLPGTSPYRLEPGRPTPGWPTLLRHPITQTPTRWYGNINPFPITYAFRPRLRGRLTLSGLTFLRNPWVFGDTVFHRVYRYSCRHAHFPVVHPSLSVRLRSTGNAPLPPAEVRRPQPVRSFGVPLSPATFSAQEHLTSELLRFL